MDKVLKTFQIQKAESSPIRDLYDLAIIFISALLITGISYFMLLKPSLPDMAAKSYAAFLKNKNYEQAALFYTDIPEGMTGPAEIKSVLKSLYDGAQDISIKDISSSLDSRIYSVKLYIKEDGTYREENISLYNTKNSLFYLKKEWKVAFPFKIKNITVKGTEGSKVFIDGVEAGQIKGGQLAVQGIICCRHNFSLGIDGIGRSDEVEQDIDDRISRVELNIIPTPEFKLIIEKLISDFCSGWASYCLSQDSISIKPYLTERLYSAYTKDDIRFQGSKYVLCQGEVSFKNLSVDSPTSLYYTLDEKWHIKETITSQDMVFKDNNRTELEQIQYINWRYHIIFNDGEWKIDSADQIGYKQEILNP
jgi:hypothetical protein